MHSIKMAMFPMTLGDPSTSKPPQFFVALHIFIVSKHRDFVFGVQVDCSKSQPMDNKASLKGA